KTHHRHHAHRPHSLQRLCSREGRPPKSARTAGHRGASRRLDGRGGIKAAGKGRSVSRQMVCDLRPLALARRVPLLVRRRFFVLQLLRLVAKTATFLSAPLFLPDDDATVVWHAARTWVQACHKGHWLPASPRSRIK